MDLRKIDALVAEHVMGIAPEKYERSTGCPTCGYDGQYEYAERYSEDIAAAWEVVTCGKWTWSVQEMADGGGRRISCYFENEDDGIWETGYGPTAPLAICIAALKAKNIDVSEWEK